MRDFTIIAHLPLSGTTRKTWIWWGTRISWVQSTYIVSYTGTVCVHLVQRKLLPYFLAVGSINFKPKMAEKEKKKLGGGGGAWVWTWHVEHRKPASYIPLGAYHSIKYDRDAGSFRGQRVRKYCIMLWKSLIRTSVVRKYRSTECH